MSVRKGEKCIAAYSEFRTVFAAAQVLPPNMLLRLADRNTPNKVRDEVRRLWRKGHQPAPTEIEVWIVGARDYAAQDRPIAKAKADQRRDKAWKRAPCEQGANESASSNGYSTTYGILKNLAHKSGSSCQLFWRAPTAQCRTWRCLCGLSALLP